MTADYGMQVIVELGHLDEHQTMQRIDRTYTGTVIKVDRARDLALVRISETPDVAPVRLAANDPVPGEHIYCLGNGRIGMLWAMKDGIVGTIGVYSEMKAAIVAVQCKGDQRECKERDETKRLLNAKYSGKLIESNCPIAGGDSGGPVVNDTAELVGLNVLTDEKGATLTNFHIPVSTIRSFVASVPRETAHVPPDPRDYNAGATKEMVDLDGDHRFESLFIDDPDRPRLLIDLAGTAKATAQSVTDDDVATFHVSVAVLRDKDRFVAYYDTNGDGRFDRVVIETGVSLISISMSTDEQGFVDSVAPAALLTARVEKLSKGIGEKLKRGTH